MNSVAAIAALLLCAVSGPSFATPEPVRDEVQPSRVPMPSEPLRVTPLVVEIPHAPAPFRGSDARYHLQYELNVESFTGDRTRLEGLDVRDESGATIAHLDAQAVAKGLVVRDHQATPGELGPSQIGILYLHVSVPDAAHIPTSISHQLTMSSGGRQVTATVAPSQVARPTSLVLDAPLRGARYIAADACCDSTRHVRATLPLNGRAYDAQRFAIDWEQTDAQGHIYVGNPKDPHSYVIYGKPAYAVADAQVVVAEDDMDDSPIGALPNLSVEKADGNCVILDLGKQRYALYAHFKPHSVRVRVGQQVHRGDVLGLVGTSGNSSEPHLHFHVSDAPSLMSDGIPYVLRHFTARRRGTSTAAFDQAVLDGTPIPTEALPGTAQHDNEYPMDLVIADLP